MLSTYYKHVPHDDHIEVQSQLRNLQTGCEAFYADWNQYPQNLDEIVPDYLPSYRSRFSTGVLVYYVSSNRQYCATWEDRNRVFDGLPGRFVIDSSSLTYKTQSEFESFLNQIPS